MKLWGRKSRTAPPAPQRCSFCRKLPSEVAKLIAGPDAFICDQCITLSAEIVAEDRLRQELGGERRLCALCGRGEDAGKGLIVSQRFICGDCVAHIQRRAAGTPAPS